MRILVVEDFGPVRGAVVTALRDEGWSVELSADGLGALEQLGRSAFDLVVLDVMIPGVDGLGVLRWMRERDIDSHVLVVTARDAVEDRVAALDAGADDYLVKPFAIEELVARARALLRRAYGRKSPVVRVGPLSVHVTARTVDWDGTTIELTPREYSLLEALAFRAGESITRGELESALYGEGDRGSSNVVDVYIGYVRKKLEADGRPRVLHTRRGHGWVLRAPEDT
ncbi:MAG: response regulator transcription factor [Planctomycetota bacterium]